ncbi:MAG: ATP-binding protein [Pyrinomonadaceae bacterium]
MRPILGRVAADEFVGRTAELQQIVSHPVASPGRGLLLLLAPSAGVSELLRQAYDLLFKRREDTVPIYFALTRGESTAVSVAIEFLNTFVVQYVAYRRNEPALCGASLTLNDLVQLAPNTDLEWIEQLVETYNRERFSNDDRAFVRFCLSVPQRVPKRNGRPFVMIDATQVTDNLDGQGDLATEMLRLFCRSGLPFVLAGLRRQVLDAAHLASCNFESLDILRLGKLSDDDARTLVEHVAIRQRVVINEETRDLLVQQFECSPFFITALLQAARERKIILDTYLDCEQLYTDELMGGRIHRYFSSLLEEIAPQPEIRKSLIRVLCEASFSERRKAPFEAWRKRLHVEADQLEKLLHGLHIQEFINWDGASVQAGGGPSAWKDYLKVRFRLDILDEPRALVVADTIADALKRAPHTMERHYRHVATLGLRELLARFNCQRVPRSLFQFDRFSKKYKGAPADEIVSGLEAETELVKLPQVVHAASCEAFSADMHQICEEGRCVVAHAFEGATYTDPNQTIWLAAEIDSSLEAGPELAALWCERLEMLATKSGFANTRIWLIANEGFSADAMQVIHDWEALASSRQQVELLTAFISERRDTPKPSDMADEFVMILPMGEDNELLAASTVEQVARRLNFQPEAINQIKHAIVEACINAAEHSLSPDRKIYQRFRVESDRLVVTISSRGVVPSNLAAQNGEPEAKSGESESAKKRRGWGLKLIRSLMDEVEFERVDEGTSLRMTKYLRNSSS